jgi:arylsulfatase A-like enzyme
MTRVCPITANSAPVEAPWITEGERLAPPPTGCEDLVVNETPEPPMTRTPTNAVVILLDSLNRHDLGCYGGLDFDTPNLDRFAAERATRFTRHVTGSLPCMPARHDILTGSLDFLWRPWGSLELWDQPITAQLRAHDVTTMLVTDHPHLFETGGENYHTDFSGWDYLRGHEGDLWRTAPDLSWTGHPAVPARRGDWWVNKQFGLTMTRGYDRSRTYFRDEIDYPGPRVMTAAREWLLGAAPQHDRFLLFIDEFDPHEPFDTPAPWRGRYEDEPWDDDDIIWPPYAIGAQERGELSLDEARHIRANYGSKLSMIDHWVGLVLDSLADRWDDTAVIICTDHGHYLGDHREGTDIWGKPAVPQYEPLGHTPLLIHWPGVSGGGTCDALTTNVDLHATLCSIFGVEPGPGTHGHSLAPLLDGSAARVRDWAIGGVFGNWVQITDGNLKYARGPVGDSFPLSMWSNRWSTMPVHLPGFEGLPVPDDRAVLDTMPWSDIPVIRQPFTTGDRLPFWANKRAIDRHALHDVSIDPDETENRVGEALEQDMQELLRSALSELAAPSEHVVRLGLG